MNYDKIQKGQILYIARGSRMSDNLTFQRCKVVKITDFVIEVTTLEDKYIVNPDPNDRNIFIPKGCSKVFRKSDGFQLNTFENQWEGPELRHPNTIPIDQLHKDDL